MSVLGGAAIGAIGNIAGGLIGSSKAKKEAAKARDWQERMDNTQVQRRVSDAKSAGIHPLAALGMTQSYSSPVGLGGGSALGDGIAAAASGVGNAVSNRGSEKRADQASTWQGLLANEELNLMNTRREFIEEQIKASKQARLQSLANTMQDNEVLKKNFGETWKTGPGSSQQEWEDQYGGIVGEMYGLTRWLQDFTRNTFK